MKPVARLLGIAFLSLALVGVVRLVADPTDVQLELPSLSWPSIDTRPRVVMNRGQRVTFDEPSAWHFAPGAVAEVWWCSGKSEVIEGPADIDNVCAFALYS